MAVDGFLPNFDFFMRWLHVIAGIMWIGHLYFFNFVNINLQAKLDKDLKKAVNPQLLPRALFWFRWGAMFTFIAGWILFTTVYMYNSVDGFGPTSAFSVEGKLQARAMWILFGMTLATVMWANVWFVIWPAQKKIIPAVRDGVAPDAALVKRATLASKINTYLSAPMLFGMLGGAGHYAGISWITVIIVLVLAEGTIWLAYNQAPKAGTSI